MASATDMQTNGVNGHHDDYDALYPRFSNVPAALDIPVKGEDGDEEAVNLDLTELLDETDELCGLLENENAAYNYWITISLAYAKLNKLNVAIDIIQRALKASRGSTEDRLRLLCCLCWLFLAKCRRAPRVKPTTPQSNGAGEDVTERTKDHWLHQATQTLNDAMRINPSYPALFLARGTLHLLRASLQPGKAGSGMADAGEKGETLKQAAKCFDDAYRSSNGRNIMALMGKAKTQYTAGNYSLALQSYQQALERAPDAIDPDPRIGIGCCLWMLGHKEHARAAWQRALDLDEDSTIANILLGLYYLDESSQYSMNDEAFAPIYKKAMTVHTQTAFKHDSMQPLTCATFGGYFLLRKTWQNVSRLARRAIEYTDVNAIASDGWYLLARASHAEGDMTKAAEQYGKSDQARGGDERGWMPAKFGAAQCRVLMGDFDGGKFRLEKIVEKSKSLEAMTLLGVLLAEDVFAAQAAGNKEDKSQEYRKAIAMLENVRLAWKDSKKRISPDSSVLLNLARLYENDQPEKALACLQQVEQMALEDISEDDLPEEMGDEEEERRSRRELLSPQLLNNLGCFHFQAEKYGESRDDFQTALNACVKLGDRASEENIDTDALVSTISYNLARTCEAEGVDEEAKKIYEGLLSRHPEYTDARTRLAYLTHKIDPEKGAQEIKSLQESEPANLEVRSLYGYYINRAKKRTLAVNEDAEQRHYKHTLQQYDKHDLYSLTGMGNLHMLAAREMPRQTDQHKEKRSKMFMRAVEFFDKVLTLDPRNAYAAQGMGIAIVEEKRDVPAAIQIFSKVRESVKDASVHINLGHVFTEAKQFSRAIENYELALAKSTTREHSILGCLGRVWLMRGRQEKKLDAYKTSLDFARQALEAASDNINYRFNVAFVQIQLAQLVNTLPESQKTLQDVESAAAGLDEAIETFSEIAKSPNPPFPRNDIEQRANMGRNTMKRQIASAIERQAEYERKNASRLEEARKRREEEQRKREEEHRVAQEKAEEDRRKIKEERERMMEEDRAMIQQKLAEEKAREAAEYTTDEETGERKKRDKKLKKEGGKRKKKGGDEGTDTEIDGVANGTSGAESGREGGRKKKKRKLERKGQAKSSSSKYKSADIVEESDEEEDDGTDAARPAGETSASEREASAAPSSAPGGGGDTPMPDQDDDDAPRPTATQRKKVARILDDEDEDEEDVAVGGETNGGEETAAGESDHGGD